jgi:WD40 repeat protein
MTCSSRACADDGSQASYLADMRAAFTAVKEGDMIRVRKLLERHEPRPGQRDYRAWEWHHLRAMCRKPSFSLRGPKAQVTALAWSGDGRRLASGHQDGTVKLWDVTKEKEAARLRGRHRGAVSGLAWSPDGKRLSSFGSQDGSVNVWDANTGAEVFTLSRTENGRAFRGTGRWSPDGRRLLPFPNEREVAIYDAATGKKALALEGHEGLIETAAWSPDGKRLATVSSDGGWWTARIWDATSGKEVVNLTVNFVSGISLAWSPDGSRLASAAWDNKEERIRIWKTYAGEKLLDLRPKLLPGEGPGPSAVAWSCDSKQVLLHSLPRPSQARFHAWDAVTGRELRRLSLPPGLFSPGGRWLLGAANHYTALRETATEELTQVLYGLAPPEYEMFDTLAGSPDGQYAAVGGSAGTVRVWSLTDRAGRCLPIQESGIAAWSTTGKELLVAENDLAVLSLDPATGKSRLLQRGSRATEPTGSSWSPHGDRLAVAYADGGVRIWPLDRHGAPVVLRGHKSAVARLDWSAVGRQLVARLDWSADGRQLVSVGVDGTVRVWDAARGEETFYFTVSPHLAWLAWTGVRVRGLAWSPAGDRLAVNTDSSQIRVYDTATGKERAQLKCRGDVRFLAWSPDGKWLAAMARDITVWEGGSGREVIHLDNFDSRFDLGSEDYCLLVWSKDSRRLAILTQGTIRTLDVATKREILSLIEVGVRALAWSPDSKQIATINTETQRLKDRVTIRDAGTGKELSSFALRDSFTVEEPHSQDHPRWWSWLSWSPDGRWFAAGDKWNTTVWDVATRKVVLTRRGPQGGRPADRQNPVFPKPEPDRVFWDAEGPRLATIEKDDARRTWTARIGKESRTVGGEWWGKLRQDPQAVSVMAWSHDRRRLAILGADLQVCSPDTGVRTVLHARRGEVALAWSPEDGRLAALGTDGITVWDLAQGKRVLHVPRARKGVTEKGQIPVLGQLARWSQALAWSPDGKQLAATADGGKVQVWEAATGKEVLTLPGHNDEVMAVAWSPDGKRLASGGADQAIKVWNAATGKEEQTLRGHRAAIISLAWSPDGRRLASVKSHEADTSSRPKDVGYILELWDPASEQPLASWTSQIGPPVWSPDGRQLASVGVHGTPYVLVLDGAPVDE